MVSQETVLSLAESALMNKYFQAVVSATTYTFVDLHCRDFSHYYPPAERNILVKRVLEHHAGSTQIVKLPIFWITLVFDVVPLAITGSCFHQLPPIQRLNHVKKCKASRIGLVKDLMQFYETLSVMSLFSYEEPYLSSTVDSQLAGQSV